jgi:transposase-like protein
MDQIVRQRRSEGVWREIVARQEKSGLTVQEFCEREGLKAASLYGWRVRLRQEPAGESAARPISKKKADQVQEVVKSILRTHFGNPQRHSAWPSQGEVE